MVPFPIGIPLIFNFETTKTVRHSCDSNIDDDQRNYSNERNGFELFDRILFVGTGQFHLKTGIVILVLGNNIKIKWDHKPDAPRVGQDDGTFVESRKCAIIPYPWEEGQGRIGPWNEPEIVRIDG